MKHPKSSPSRSPHQHQYNDLPLWESGSMTPPVQKVDTYCQRVCLRLNQTSEASEVWFIIVDLLQEMVTCFKAIPKNVDPELQDKYLEAFSYPLVSSFQKIVNLKKVGQYISPEDGITLITSLHTIIPGALVEHAVSCAPVLFRMMIGVTYEASDFKTDLDPIARPIWWTQLLAEVIPNRAASKLSEARAGCISLASDPSLVQKHTKNDPLAKALFSGFEKHHKPVADPFSADYFKALCEPNHGRHHDAVRAFRLLVCYLPTVGDLLSLIIAVGRSYMSSTGGHSNRRDFLTQLLDPMMDMGRVRVIQATPSYNDLVNQLTGEQMPGILKNVSLAHVPYGSHRTVPALVKTYHEADVLPAKSFEAYRVASAEVETDLKALAKQLGHDIQRSARIGVKESTMNLDGGGFLHVKPNSEEAGHLNMSIIDPKSDAVFAFNVNLDQIAETPDLNGTKLALYTIGLAGIHDLMVRKVSFRKSSGEGVKANDTSGTDDPGASRNSNPRPRVRHLGAWTIIGGLDDEDGDADHGLATSPEGNLHQIVFVPPHWRELNPKLILVARRFALLQKDPGLTTPALDQLDEKTKPLILGRMTDHNTHLLSLHQCLAGLNLDQDTIEELHQACLYWEGRIQNAFLNPKPDAEPSELLLTLGLTRIQLADLGHINEARQDGAVRQLEERAQELRKAGWSFDVPAYTLPPSRISSTQTLVSAHLRNVETRALGTQTESYVRSPDGRLYLRAGSSVQAVQVLLSRTA